MKTLKNNKVFIILILITLCSCKDKSANLDAKIDLPNLTLNNGKKWIANEETQVGMTHIDSILKSYKKADKTNSKALADSLSKETSFIIKSCDMKGEAHDQLHIVLVPMLELISDLKDKENTDVIDKNISNLQYLVKTYFEYFKM